MKIQIELSDAERRLHGGKTHVVLNAEDAQRTAMQALNGGKASEPAFAEPVAYFAKAPQPSPTEAPRTTKASAPQPTARNARAVFADFAAPTFDTAAYEQRLRAEQHGGG
jgi:hypothetical protein